MGKFGERRPRIALLLICLAILAAFPSRQTVLARGSERATGVLVAEEPPPAPAGIARFDRITTADGLSDDRVNAILQDQWGYMWFGTDNGLARYDGYQFTIYQSDPADPTTLSHDVVYTIIQTRSGDLWVGTQSGLDRFDATNGTFTHYLSGHLVLALCEDEEGILWVGAASGLTHLDPADPRPSSFFRAGTTADPLKPSGTAMNAILRDREGEIWLATGTWAQYVGIGRGLNRYDRPSKTFVRYNHDPADPTSLSSGDVRTIFQDRQGALWVGTEGGLNRLDRSTNRFSRFLHDPADPASLAADRVSAVLEDSAGRLWIGTADGLDQLDRSQNRFIHYRHDRDDPRSVSGDTILALYEDRSGVVWIGTTTGLNRYDETASQFAVYQSQPNSPYRLSDDSIQAVAEDRNGELWIGTARGGLNRVDRNTNTVTVYRHDPSDPASLSSDGITAICEDRDGVLWVTTDAQWLERFDPLTGTFLHFWYVSAGMPSAITQDQAGNLWIGTSGGLYRLNPATKTSNHFRSTKEPELTTNYVTAIYKLHGGQLLVGTEGGGLNIWDPVAERFSYVFHDPANANSLAHNSVYSFYENPDGTLIWIGTWQGLDRIDVGTQAITHYTEEDGLLGHGVLGIQADGDGMLWLATKKGLSRFDPLTRTFRNFDVREGLPDGRLQRTAVAQTRRGEMLIGSSAGLIAFHPERLQENPDPPPIVVTAISLFNKVMYRNLTPEEPILLSYKQNFLSFEFAALDYAAPEKNQYAYRLEGIDTDWVQAGTRRRADYPNLGPGNYIFRVNGSNNAGVWNEEGIAIPVTIAPPPWGTWWFRGLVALVLLGLVLGAYRWRVRSIEARGRALERQVADRTAELSTANARLEQEIAERKRTQEALAQERAAAAVTAERNRLARELHDSATQSLYAVTLYADAATRLLAAGQTEPAAENLLKARGTAKEALSEMRMLIFELRPPILDEKGLVAALEGRLEAVESRSGWRTELHVVGEGRPSPAIEEGLYHIAVEALNNALRHAQARRISVSLRFETEATHLEVADDGVGFDPAAARKAGGLGLPGMAERAAQLGGTLTVDTRPGTGTRVQAVVPNIAAQVEVPG